MSLLRCFIRSRKRNGLFGPSPRTLPLPHVGVRYSSAAALRKEETSNTPTPAPPDETSKVVRNEAGVQLLSRSLKEQIFRNADFPKPDPQAIAVSRSHLKAHGLAQQLSKEYSETPVQLPRLQGDNLDEHFWNLGLEHSAPYLQYARELSRIKLPPRPQTWFVQSGWTKYSQDGSFEAVDYPPDEAMVFDVETLYKESNYAVLAVAASADCWYGWMSPWLLGETEDPKQLISFDGRKPRLLVGHNVGYDRARVLEEYSIERSPNRFLDTMALHVAVHGLSNPQRMAWMRHRKAKAAQQASDDEAIANSDDASFVSAVTAKMWQDVSSLNSLADVAKLHCGIEMDKTIRDVFGEYSREQVVAQADTLMSYCATDVEVTHRVYSVVLPAFLKVCPNPVTFAGVLHMGNAFLPVDESWPKYLHDAEEKYKELAAAVQDRLHDLANEARKLIGKKLDGDRFAYEDDPWLKQLDWTPKKARRIVSDRAAMGTDGFVEMETIPRWKALSADITISDVTAALLLRMKWRGHPLFHSSEHGWVVGVETSALGDFADQKHLVFKQGKDSHLANRTDFRFFRISEKSRVRTLFGKPSRKWFHEGNLSSERPEAGLAVELGASGDVSESDYDFVQTRLKNLADDAAQLSEDLTRDDPWLSQLDWTPVKVPLRPPPGPTASDGPEAVAKDPMDLVWPKWFWDLDKPDKGGLNLTVKARAAPLLLKLRWRGYPLYHSRQHGWLYRVPQEEIDSLSTRQTPVEFLEGKDNDLYMDKGGVFFKIPHKDGEEMNVGSPLSKTFIAAFESGILTSEYKAAKDALDMNAQCSYWISARERILTQFVVWDSDAAPNAIPSVAPSEASKMQGLILPQVVTMGTVTRRAVERTWLTASNAKKNRVGSELKSMVRAPPGWAIVGADVDSEELWICSVMGDAQFGIHGATAIGWMTLEGSKSTGTDLHSKTASILGISRDGAKVFNYSRIYGAGVKHAVQLLLQSNPALTTEKAQELAKALYASTKGLVSYSQEIFGRKFWHGGTESYVFNKLEQIAMSDNPRTPALGCGITQALSKANLPATERSKAGEDFMPSRINWVVQSSGVDYLHMLIVSMEYLIRRFDINARFMIAIHDEIRYMVREEDKYRLALALQISNLWTRSMFAYKLEMDNLPQSCAWFSAVDIDHVLRKEVNMPCITPSHPTEIPSGQSLDIEQVIAETNGGTLFRDGGSMEAESSLPSLGLSPKDFEPQDFYRPTEPMHRAKNTIFLAAQAAKTKKDVNALWRYAQEYGSGELPKDMPQPGAARKRSWKPKAKV